ncbi:MAG: glycosyltransferase family 4 protein [Candidatus Vogelbacteria bacterium]|nr:glycosyltransferase family 4 protein [Candidatus Vogelbacteria bacterium]
MRILSISSDAKLFEDGSPVVLRQIKYGELASRLDIVNLSLKSGSVMIKNLSDKVTVYHTGSSLKFFYFWDAYQIAKKLNKPDLVTVQDPFETGLTALLVARYFKCPLQVQIHTDFLSPYYFRESLKNRIRVWISCLVLPRSQCIRVVSQRIKKSIRERLPSVVAPIDVLPVFVVGEKFKAEATGASLREKYPQFRFILLMASRLTKEKNMGLAVEAMKRVVERHPDAGLVIVGSGPMRRDLSSSIERLGLNNNVVVEDWNNDLISYYKTADVFLNTSNYEGYGMAPVEAILSGLPVIMTDVGVAGDVIKDGVNGLVVPVNDVVALGNAICEFIENEEERRKLILGAKETKIEDNEASHPSRYKQCWEKCVL